jgi:4,5-DOPA dioxygenase extradiol
MPALYLSHGAPPLADHPSWPGELAAWSGDLPRPSAILMISAHWEEAPASRLAHPRTEHFAPLFVTLGAAADELVTQRTVIDGFWHGMARRSVQFG